jgi:hypothetical protein
MSRAVPAAVRSRDDGSTIPLILGFLMLALLLVAGSVAVGDAYVAQSNLQSVCDGAAAAAASRADADTQRRSGDSGGYLRLGDVQAEVQRYLQREPSRSDVVVTAVLDASGTTVQVSCERRAGLAFGSFFGFGSGIEQHATSAARAPATI